MNTDIVEQVIDLPPGWLVFTVGVLGAVVLLCLAIAIAWGPSALRECREVLAPAPPVDPDVQRKQLDALSMIHDSAQVTPFRKGGGR